MLPAYEEVLVNYRWFFDDNVLREESYHRRLARDQLRDVDGRHVYQILSQEFVDALAAHLQNRGSVVEVGAGGGALSKELKERNIDIIATDAGNFNLEVEDGVARLDYRDAIRKYQPAVVISSWMPYGEDWTKDFRRFNCVQEYILIGEIGECCGDESVWRHPGFKLTQLKSVTRFSVSPKVDRFWGNELRRTTSVISFRRFRTKKANC